MTTTKIKAAVRARDGYRCTKCNMTAEEHRKRYGRTLDVHRIIPGSVYTVDGCVTRCKLCHSKEDQRLPGEVDHARPPRVALSEESLMQLRTIECFKQEMDEPFDAAEFLGIVAAKAVAQLHAKTMATFLAFHAANL